MHFSRIDQSQRLSAELQNKTLYIIYVSKTNLIALYIHPITIKNHIIISLVLLILVQSYLTAKLSKLSLTVTCVTLVP